MKVEQQSQFISTEISALPTGVNGKIHVWGQNNMTTSQKMGIHWVAKDPAGIVADDYEDWSFASISPGSTHEFIGSKRFPINKPGTWTVVIGLFMNPTAPVQVDSYSGVLCVVEQLMGTIVKKELEYDETRGSIPVY